MSIKIFPAKNGYFVKGQFPPQIIPTMQELLIFLTDHLPVHTTDDVDVEEVIIALRRMPFMEGPEINPLTGRPAGEWLRR